MNGLGVFLQYCMSRDQDLFSAVVIQLDSRIIPLVLVT